MSVAIQALLAVNAVIMAAIAAMIGYLLKQFLPVKEKVDMLWVSWWGPDDAEDSGALAEFRGKHKEIRDEHETARDIMADARDEQRAAFSDIFQYLNSLSLMLQHQDIETPDPDDNIDQDAWRGSFRRSADDEEDDD